MARGTEILELADLRDIETPPATRTYTPLSHFDLSSSLITISQDILSGYELIDQRFEVARNRQQLFGILTFNANQGEMGLSVGFRNSMDRSMSVGLCVGSQVTVCSNMMFTAQGGGIVVMKKHSKNLLDTLEDTTITTLYRASYTFNQLVKDSEFMKGRAISNDEAFKTLGLLFGHGHLTPRQLPVARDQWIKPNHPEFEPRNMWSLYNAITESMKSNPPHNTLERSINLHQAITGEWS